MPGWFMNFPQYVLVKVQLVIRFQTSLSHIHLQAAQGCALGRESKKLFHPREGELIASDLNKLVLYGFLTCLLPDSPKG